MLGQQIIISSPPKGVFEEGTINDTSLPGTIMQMYPNQAFVGGRPGYQHSNESSSGGVGATAILLPDNLQGQLNTTAYVSGTRCFIYYPVVGEEYNICFGVSGGTGNHVTQGDLLMVDTLTGTLIAISGNPAGPIFQAMESFSSGGGGQASNTLLWVKLINL